MPVRQHDGVAGTECEERRLIQIVPAIGRGTKRQCLRTSRQAPTDNRRKPPLAPRERRFVLIVRLAPISPMHLFPRCRDSARCFQALCDRGEAERPAGFDLTIDLRHLGPAHRMGSIRRTIETGTLDPVMPDPAYCRVPPKEHPRPTDAGFIPFVLILTSGDPERTFDGHAFAAAQLHRPERSLWRSTELSVFPNMPETATQTMVNG